ncbi:MAG: hypothetical protein ABJK20_12705 [Halieaceae bacterium]
MPKLRELFASQQRLLQQAREIEELKQQLTVLQMQNDSMREGMRRCVSCDYRIDYKSRQDQAVNKGLID